MFDIRTALVNGPNNAQAFIIVESSNQNWQVLEDRLNQSIPELCKLLKNDINFSFNKSFFDKRGIQTFRLCNL